MEKGYSFFTAAKKIKNKLSPGFSFEPYVRNAVDVKTNFYSKDSLLHSCHHQIIFNNSHLQR
jgi:hypothetical protein